MIALRALVFSVVLMATLRGTAEGQTVSGSLVDEATGRIIASVPVSLMDGQGRARVQTVTDTAGGFKLRAPGPGGFWLRLEPVGYRRVETRPFVLERGDSLVFPLATRAQVASLEGLTVSAAQNQKYAGFLDRSTSGFGRYFGPDFVERQRVSSASDLLMGLTPGLVVPRDQPASFRNRGRNCFPVVLVDGFQYGSTTRPVVLDEIVMGMDVAAVEVYTQPNFVPAELTMSPFNTCGAIVIWTRHALGID